MSMDNPLLAIIGTAGRGEDAKKLTPKLWNKAKGLTLKFLEDHGITYLISGGAAFADSLCPEAFLSEKVKQVNKIVLCLPCEFDYNKCQFVDNYKMNFVTNPGGTCNYYHRNYSKLLGKNSLEILRTALLDGRTYIKIGNGFFDRNEMVADMADMVLAITFGDKEILKDGGTADTTKKFIGKNGNDNVYHLNLNDLKIYGRGKV